MQRGKSQKISWYWYDNQILFRKQSVKAVDERLAQAKHFQLLYDGKKINNCERFLFAAQYTDKESTRYPSSCQLLLLARALTKLCCIAGVKML